MLGGIYTNQRCPVCGRRFKDNGRNALICPEHPQYKADRFFVRFKNVFRRFSSYNEANRFLTGLRYKWDEGTFDDRDYRKDKPLGFSNLANQWLQIKRGEVRCFRNIDNHMGRACAYFENRNIKDIGYAELEDFLHSLPDHLSAKSKKNILTTVHSFYTWLRKRRILSSDQIPEFPEVKYELGWRKTVDKQTQQEILDEIKRISYHINPKIWIGIKWLCTYIAIRPIELIHIREGDFDFELGVVTVRYNKEKKPKIVPLLPEDLEIVKSFPRALPHVYFFRHGDRKGVAKSKRGQFGKDYLYKWWKKACANLGVEGVDLYGGTRHSSVRALREWLSPEQIRKGTMHSTNVAFERYYKIELEDMRNVYKHTLKKNGCTTFAPNFSAAEKSSDSTNLLE